MLFFFLGGSFVATHGVASENSGVEVFFVLELKVAVFYVFGQFSDLFFSASEGPFHFLELV